MDKNLLLFLKDLRVFYILSRKLNENDIPWTLLENTSDLPYIEAAIVSNAEGINEIKNSTVFRRKNLQHLYSFINYDNFPNYDSLYVYILKTLWNIEHYSVLLVGIDPGQKNIGLAFFLDNNLICTEVVHDPEETVDRINLYTLTLKPRFLRIEIGTGNLRSLKNLIRLFIGFNKNIYLTKTPKIILVDEKYSTKEQKQKFHYEIWYHKGISKDEKAAVIIGIRAGTEITRESLDRILKKKINVSELKHIQRLSRKMSGGRISLSRDLAQKVYEGLITMDSALEIQNKRKLSQRPER